MKMPKEFERLNLLRIYIPATEKELIRKACTLAQELGINRSRLFIEAIREWLEEKGQDEARDHHR